MKNLIKFIHTYKLCHTVGLFHNSLSKMCPLMVSGSCFVSFCTCFVLIFHPLFDPASVFPPPKKFHFSIFFVSILQLLIFILK